MNKKHPFPPIPPPLLEEGFNNNNLWSRNFMGEEQLEQDTENAAEELSLSPPKSPWRKLLRIPGQWMDEWRKRQKGPQQDQFTMAGLTMSGTFPSARGDEPPSKKPKRNDLAVVRTRKKASLKEATQLAREAGPGSKHIAELEANFSAASSKATVASKRETIKKIMGALPICDTVFPLSVYKVKALAAVLMKAGYTSAEGYLVEAKCAHIEEGWEWTPQLDRFFKMAKRACARGKGPEKRAPEVRIDKWWSKRMGVTNGPASVFFPNELFVLAACFLLREIELAAFSVEELKVDRALQQVCLQWNVSKMDPTAKGIQRVLKCQCKSFVCGPNCPFKVADDLLAKLKAKALDPSGLCWTRRREKATKAQIIATWTKVYGTKVTGHSPRRSGTMRYLREGWSIAQIAYLGRWKSSVVYKYAEEALAELPALSRDEHKPALSKGEPGSSQLVQEETQKLQDLWTATAVKVERYKADAKSTAKALKEEIEILKKAAKGQGLLPKRVKALQGGKVHCNMSLPVFSPAVSWKTRCGWHFGCGSFIFLHEGEVTCEKCASFAPEQEGGRDAKAAS